MKKILLLLLFIPLVSFPTDFKYIREMNLNKELCQLFQILIKMGKN